jgi:hypothetical protein
MRDFTEYIYITEAWANTKNYKKELQNLMDAYKKKVESEAKKKAKGAMHWYPGRKQPEEILAKYPMQIIIDKLGYEPKTLVRQVWGPDGSKDKNVKELSLEILKDAMKIGKLGTQFVLMSEKAFRCIKYVKSEVVPKSDNYKNFRIATKTEYLRLKKEDDINNTYLRDIMRKEK